MALYFRARIAISCLCDDKMNIGKLNNRQGELLYALLSNGIYREFSHHFVLSSFFSIIFFLCSCTLVIVVIVGNARGGNKLECN